MFEKQLNQLKHNKYNNWELY